MEGPEAEAVIKLAASTSLIEIGCVVSCVVLHGGERPRGGRMVGRVYYFAVLSIWANVNYFKQAFEI